MIQYASIKRSYTFKDKLDAMPRDNIKSYLQLSWWKQGNRMWSFASYHLQGSGDNCIKRYTKTCLSIKTYISNGHQSSNDVCQIYIIILFLFVSLLNCNTVLSQKPNYNSDVFTAMLKLKPAQLTITLCTMFLLWTLSSSALFRYNMYIYYSDIDLATSITFGQLISSFSIAIRLKRTNGCFFYYLQEG